MACVAIIPARGGSRRIPRKNLKPFFGKPIMVWSIEIARASGLFDFIVVSSEDDEILSTAAAAQALTLRRPRDLADDEVGTQEVARHALQELELSGEHFACVIYPTAPMMSVENLNSARNLVAGSFLYAMSVGIDPLRDAGQFYFGRVRAFTSQIPLIGHWTAMVPVDERRCIDINTMDDWNKAEEMYMKLEKVK